MTTYIAWKPSLSVFVDEIDQQHQELYKRLDRFLGAVIEGEGKEEITHILKFLIDYCVVHFGTEELYMQRHTYPGYAQHKAVHEQLTGKVLAIQRQIEDGLTSQHVIQLVNQLGSWVSEHIEHMDKKLGLYLKARQERVVPTTSPPVRVDQPEPVDELAMRYEPTCAHVSQCAVMFNKFRDPESNGFWRTRYCLSQQSTDCMRKKMIDAGSAASDIPITLLPNGDHLSTLAR